MSVPHSGNESKKAPSGAFFRLYPLQLLSHLLYNSPMDEEIKHKINDLIDAEEISISQYRFDYKINKNSFNNTKTAEDGEIYQVHMLACLELIEKSKYFIEKLKELIDGSREGSG